ncbi:GNAT family N-acetyltransferase [Nocardia sp. NEAU-G5]|uniref:GNAT family N-acetyltransferase n=1 Tax=Nocardia albiluteola TaxID=2842303 RepID=A0ABS6B7A2_9NOCA|nr:GNAT family N-acetyltransferase [Nocardia albiluteola]MBU3066200.1 GNAT family N-acetyltransferase [Nocardia albiluteola]
MGDVSANTALQTARLALRRPVPGDVDAILEIYGDTHPGVLTVTTRDGAQRIYDEWNEHWDRHGYGYWVIRLRGESAVAGFSGVRTMQYPAGTVLNLFYRLAPAVRGRGLATEAASAVVAWSHAHLPELPVIARIQPDNHASPGVALRAGLSPAEHLNTDSWIHYCDPADWGREG